MRYMASETLAARAAASALGREVRLLGLAPALAPFTLDQDDVVRRARIIFGHRMSDFERLAKLFENTGIARRQAVRPAEWYHEPRGWPERTETYLETGTALFTQAARKALERAGLEGRGRRHHRHRLLHRHRHPEPGGARRGRPWASAPTCGACRCSASAAPAGSGAELAARLAGAEPGSTCCSWRSSSAPSPSASTELQQGRTSSPPPCSATAPRQPWSAPAGAGRPGRADRGRARAHLAGHPRHHGLVGRRGRASA